MSTSSKFAPASANLYAIASPIPVPEPVIKALLFLSDISSCNEGRALLILSLNLFGAPKDRVIKSKEQSSAYKACAGTSTYYCLYTSHS